VINTKLVTTGEGITIIGDGIYEDAPVFPTIQTYEKSIVDLIFQQYRLSSMAIYAGFADHTQLISLCVACNHKYISATVYDKLEALAKSMGRLEETQLSPESYLTLISSMLWYHSQKENRRFFKHI
jgi:hypothetical protein